MKGIKIKIRNGENIASKEQIEYGLREKADEIIGYQQINMLRVRELNRRQKGLGDLWKGFVEGSKELNRKEMPRENYDRFISNAGIYFESLANEKIKIPEGKSAASKTGHEAVNMIYNRSVQSDQPIKII